MDLLNPWLKSICNKNKAECPAYFNLENGADSAGGEGGILTFWDRASPPLVPLCVLARAPAMLAGNELPAPKT
eukprot:5131601-Amphidinium_carterae.1